MSATNALPLRLGAPSFFDYDWTMERCPPPRLARPCAQVSHTARSDLRIKP